MKTTNTLYELGLEWEVLERLLEESEGEVTDEIADFLHGHETAVSKKVDGYARFILNLEASARARREEAGRLKNSADGLARKVATLKAALRAYMGVAEIRKLEGDVFTVSLRKAGGKCAVALRDGVSVDDLPMRYKAEKWYVDNEQLRRGLESGDETIAELAELKPRGEYLKVG